MSGWILDEKKASRRQQRRSVKDKEAGVWSGWDWLSQAGISKEQLGNMSSGIPGTRFDPDVHTACSLRLWVT